MYLLQLTHRDLGVDRRGFEIRVTKKLLDVTDVRTVFEHEGGAGVTEEVATSLAAQVGRLDVTSDEAGEVIGRDRITITGEEQRPLRSVHLKLGPRLIDVFAHPKEGTLTDGHHTVFLALALADVEQRPVDHEVGQVEVAQFATPDRRRVKHLHDGPVPQPQRLMDVRQREHAFDIGQTQR